MVMSAARGGCRSKTHDEVEDGEHVPEDHQRREAHRRVEDGCERLDELVRLAGEVVEAVVEACPR